MLASAPMGRGIRRTAVVAAFAVGLLAPAAGAPPVAHAGPYEDVFADFQSDGSIDACEHSEADLRRAKADIPNDIDQYAKEFPGELDDAIEKRAERRVRGGGHGRHAGGRGAHRDDRHAAGHHADPAAARRAPAPRSRPGRAAPRPPPPTARSSARRSRRPTSAAPSPLRSWRSPRSGSCSRSSSRCGAWPACFAWEPRWLPGARHAVAEAGWRTGGAWSDFADWIRSRRAA